VQLGYSENYIYVILQERKKYVVQWEKEKATLPKQNKQIN